MPSATLEEYLEAIYKISLKGEVRPSQIAESLGVSAPSVTAGLRRLESAGLVSRSGGGVVLTDAGMSESVAIVRRHRLAERFLVDVLGMEWDTAHDEACRLEHALSDQVLEALEAFMENPESCPHGHPIPRIDGGLPAEVGVPLADLAPGASATVVSVPEQEDVLAYLSRIGLKPGSRVTVEDVAPFDGPLLVALESGRSAMDRAIAAAVTVKVDA